MEKAFWNGVRGLFVWVGLAVSACSEPTCDETLTCAVKGSAPDSDAGARDSSDDPSEGGRLRQPCGSAGHSCCAAAAACRDSLECVGGRCQCGGTKQFCGSCVDTNTDPKHCGRCNHSCLGGTCLLGKCQSVLLASSTNIVTTLQVTDSEIVWGVDDGPIAKRNKDGSGAITTLVDRDLAYDSAFSEGTLYWVNDFLNKEIRACKVAGCNKSPTMFYQHAGGNYLGLLHDPINSQLIFSTAETSPGARDAVVAARTFAGTDRVLVDGRSSVIAHALDSTYVYWLEWSAAVISKTPLIGGTTVPLFIGTPSTPNNFGNFEIADGALFFTRHGVIYRVPLPRGVGSGEPPRFHPGYACYLAADETHLYWTDCGGNVLRCPLTGCIGLADVLAGAQVRARAIEVDAAAIYWTTDVGVRMLAK